MITVWSRAQLLITTAWVGSIWTIGYLVAPTLFKTLADQALAGTIAGQLFFVEACLSLVCGIALLAIWFAQHRKIHRKIVGMVMCTVVGFFALHPFMADLRAAGLSDPDVRWKFGALHGLSSGFYLMQSIIGAMLILERLDNKPDAKTKKEAVN